MNQGMGIQNKYRKMGVIMYNFNYGGLGKLY